MESGSFNQVGAMSSRICPISVVSASFASQSAAEKNDVNCAFMASRSDPKSRYPLPSVGRK